jgi:HK97 family phage major capsid protein
MPKTQVEEEDRFAKEIVGKNLSGAYAERLMSTLTDAAGGYLLPKPFLAELFVIIEQFGFARRYFRPIPMISRDYDLRNVATKPVAYWTDEGANFTASDLVFGADALTTKKLAGITSWTTELTEDEAIAFLPMLQQLFAESIGTKEDSAGFVGGGNSDTANGKFTGLLTAVASGNVVAQAATKLPADLTFDDLKSVRDKLSLARRSGAVWFMHPNIESILEGIKDKNDNYIYRKPSDNTSVGYLWGYPVVPVEAMPVPSAASNRYVVFGNPSYMLMGQRRGVTVDVSREAVLQSGEEGNPIVYNSFQADGQLLRISVRVGFACADGNRFAAIATGAAN